MVPDQGADLGDQPPRRPQPVQEALRRLDPGPVMAGGAEPLGHERLAEVVAEDREHERLVVLAAAAKLRGPVEGQQGVAPYVALGMPARVLGRADERLDLREEPHEAGLPEEVEADGGAHPEEQVLAKLREHALRSELREVEPAGEGQELRVGIELEAGRELRRPEPPQGVFREVRGVGDPEPLRRQVLPAAVGIEDFTRDRIVADGVDPEVAPAGGGREVEVRGDLDREPPMPGPRLVVAPGQREVGVEPVDAEDPEGLPDRSGPSEAREDRLDPLQGEPEHFDVHVGRGAPEYPVAHLPPDEEGAPARFADRLRDLAEARVRVAEVGPGRERRSLHRAVRRLGMGQSGGQEGVRREERGAPNPSP